MTCVSMLLVCRAVTSRVQPPLSSQCGRHMSRGWGLVTLRRIVTVSRTRYVTRRGAAEM